MAKLIKSFFNTAEKKSNSKGLVLDEEVVPPLDDRRRLSISRSGRMKQANKKRRSLCPDLYGEEINVQVKSASNEYHVHNKSFTANSTTGEASMSKQAKRPDAAPEATVRRQSMDLPTSPEEEIDSAFEILDKTDLK